MTSTDDELARDRADQQWEFGRIAAARDGYAQLCAANPGDWRSRFQIAWIDAAFAPPSAATLESLSATELTEGARDRLEMLAARATATRFLAGGVGDWDITALREQDPDGKDAKWWEQRARLTADAGQYGLAGMCYREAAKLNPGAYVRPPSDATSLTAELAGHFAALRPR
jgi:hypothetical protein